MKKNFPNYRVFAHVKHNSLDTTRRSFGLSDAMLEMRGKTFYKFHLTEHNNSVVIYDDNSGFNFAFHAYDIEIIKDEDIEKPENIHMFDINDL
jgi:hypothetical protein